MTLERFLRQHEGKIIYHLIKNALVISKQIFNYLLEITSKVDKVRQKWAPTTAFIFHLLL